MKVKTQVIDKIEDVREGDIVNRYDGNHIAIGVHDNGRMIDTTRGWVVFNECAVLRFTVEGEVIEQHFTQQQAQAMYEKLEEVYKQCMATYGSDYMGVGELLNKLENNDE